MRVERLAWLVVVASFFLFCGSCATVTLGFYTFMFTSTVPIAAMVEVGRGTALLTNPDLSESGVRDYLNVTGRIISLSMDSQAQAMVALRRTIDSSEPTQELLASITLLAGSEVRFTRATMPRFSWTNAIYDAVLRDFTGQMEITITASPDRPVVIDVYTSSGRMVRLNGAGRYSLDANATRLHVVTIAGEAVLFSSQGNANRIIPQGQQGVIYAERSAPSVYPARNDIVQNGLFAFNADPTTPALPARWGCSNVQDSTPRGAYEMNNWQGRLALRLVRADNASSHGETRCFQPIDVGQRDVSQYNYMELQTSFLLNNQSLSDCGTQGSECPLMLRMTYTDANNVDREWFQGFYAQSNPSAGYPPRCASCTQEHLQVNPRVWYTFNTGNLFATISPLARPARINSIEFYASGHQYDVYVGEVSLNVGYLDNVVEVGN